MELFIALTIGLLFATAVFLILQRNIIRSAIGLLVLSNAINLLLLTAGANTGTEPAYTTALLGPRADALPEALILTAIVISMGGAALVLGMLFIIATRYNTSNSDKIDGLKY
jgi:multicomponent Na+:H+ antiporter subunit C